MPPAPASAAAPSASADAAPPKASPKVTDTFTTPAGELTVTPIHHATMLLRLGDKAIYLDPVAADASYEGLPKADFVFITHTHPDHMDPAGIAKVQKSDTVLVGPPAVNETTPLKVVMKNGDTHDFGTFTVEAVPMYNLTRGPSAGKLFHDKGQGDGYVFTFGGKAGAKAADSGTAVSRLYVSGDTECTPEMKALKNIDVAFVCMNLPYTMPPAEAATCINAFKPKVVFPFHYKGSNLDELTAAIKPGSGIEVRKREWY
jgi:L-ascorbate metabolism protein UlaG (beta-lactamase superfamily)